MVLDRCGPDGFRYLAENGTWYAFVPIVFAGNGVPAQRVSRPVETVDIAPTLSAYLGIKPPSGSPGKPPVEVTPEWRRP